MIKLFIDYGVDLDACSPKDWTPLSYSRWSGGILCNNLVGPIMIPLIISSEGEDINYCQTANPHT